MSAGRVDAGGGGPAAAGGTVLFVANRGEIACRVARTGRLLGMTVVVPYSPHDRGALHRRLADRAVPVPSYLDPTVMADAALAAGAGLVHPGYGFLSENPLFAAAVADRGMTFVGPSPAAMRRLGDKNEARRLAVSLGVPVLPAVELDAAAPDPASAVAAAGLSYPLLVKAAAGGGGRGMRRAERPEDLPGAVAAAAREAGALFGSAAVFAETYLARARHVEVQVVGDSHGGVCVLGDRDCSLQRSHQKVVEEAPAPGLSPATRAGLADAARSLVSAAAYSGAATAEFLVARDGRYFFLEVNSRLQVEHPVTEEVFGVDLVRLQLDVARGGRVPPGAGDPRGVAVEARICAEDPAAGFAPSAGVLSDATFPASAHVRVDAGYVTGDEVTPYYDSLVAKVIAVGPDRAAAISRLREALSLCRVTGVSTNLSLLGALTSLPEWVSCDHHTGTLHDLVGAAAPTAAGAAAGAAGREAAVAAHFVRTLAPEGDGGPWRSGDGWRIGGGAADEEVRTEWTAGGESYDVASRQAGGAVRVRVTGGPPPVSEERRVVAAAARTRRGVRLTTEAGERSYLVETTGNGYVVSADGLSVRVVPRPPAAAAAGAERERGRAAPRSYGAKSPVPGVIVSVAVLTGEVVAEGDTLFVTESMKTEHTVRARRGGRVTRVTAGPGTQVSGDDVIVEIES